MSYGGMSCRGDSYPQSGGHSYPQSGAISWTIARAKAPPTSRGAEMARVRRNHQPPMGNVAPRHQSLGGWKCFGMDSIKYHQRTGEFILRGIGPICYPFLPLFADSETHNFHRSDITMNPIHRMARIDFAIQCEPSPWARDGLWGS